MWGMIWGMNGVAQSQEVSRVWRAVTDCKGQVNGVEAGRGAPLKLLIVELSAVRSMERGGQSAFDIGTFRKA